MKLAFVVTGRRGDKRSGLEILINSAKPKEIKVAFSKRTEIYSRSAILSTDFTSYFTLLDLI